MHIHILGICGTFMGGVAKLAIESGHQVTGCDQNVYPPMSTQLQQLGITVISGFDPSQLDDAPDLVVIGNALSRGNPCVEAVLERGLAYTSGPQWLHDHVLHGRWVLAVAGTHGKTTTASMLAWILDDNGYAPGFLIGGVARNFDQTARLGKTPFFVVEADEYDSAFFDKRSKFVHYNPRTLILNNLEYDHADIFPDLAAIQRQFHHLVRTVANIGQIIRPADSQSLQAVMDMGCWSEQVLAGDNSPWQIKARSDDWQQFEVSYQGVVQGRVQWPLIGVHNAQNALMAIIAARHVGVLPEHAIASLAQFEAPKRRLEQLAVIAGVTIYDDFAHHPTAVKATLSALRAKIGAKARLTAVFEPRSNTMKLGVHQHSLVESLTLADSQFIYTGDTHWDIAQLFTRLPSAHCYRDLNALLVDLVSQCQADEHIVLMSNGGFGGLAQKLIQALNKQSI
ncbi:UDP-N-acetylmuramate:L-alanyl-gamma-D-glutamyl-meso-diaminopimelate ligase [Celerinatantimonas yamalensis]|uniref:UDP-N-acetylmuramate--L-alanyl-gamma-D-glutamyl-meso-2,6-diaminoheptandioate ligase n=1 Tax=Celerinatantimonas yamalensis TaxID=559956 RepID=A0ABW9GAL2_9GAMM